MTYLVDANVLSEATRPAPNTRVVSWLRRNEKDSMIAATALANGFTVATRNVGDFKKARVKIVDPFA